MREAEGIDNAVTSNLLGKGLFKTLRTVLSQCRGRGFESLHLHQKPSSEAYGEIPEEPLSATGLC